MGNGGIQHFPKLACSMVLTLLSFSLMFLNVVFNMLLLSFIFYISNAFVFFLCCMNIYETSYDSACMYEHDESCKKTRIFTCSYDFG